METLNAIYVRMNILLEEMGLVSRQLISEIKGLNERMSKLYISWEGEAYAAYHRVLMEDIRVMEETAMDAMFMYILLREALERYRKMELQAGEVIGGLK